MTGHSRENPPYWPGGIPEHIQCHPHPIPPSEVGDEVKGWLLFVDVRILMCGNITCRKENDLISDI